VTKHVERDTVLGHEDEADGIQEYDNPLPDWWLGLFWATILFAVAYGVHYHFIAHRSPQKALAHELAAAEQRWPAEQQAGTGTALALTEEAAEAGERVFTANCVPCHGASMRGGIGPDLLDDEWIHGGSPEQILKTITEGVPAKGMPPWGPILGAAKTREVAAYVVLQNAKALGRPVPTAEEHEREGQEREH
jgi:cytochrome c oxidase cbb3-type subunit 3